MKRAFRIYRKSAELRFLDFDLSPREFDAIVHEPCFYCGACGRNGIDRIDSADGYVRGNVVTCCARCNRAKGSMSFREFIAMCAIIAHRFQVDSAAAQQCLQGRDAEVRASKFSTLARKGKIG